MESEGKPWDETKAREITRAALDAITARQAATMPACPACGQRTKPTRDGLCSRVTDEHRRLVQEWRWKTSQTQ